MQYRWQIHSLVLRQKLQSAQWIKREIKRGSAKRGREWCRQIWRAKEREQMWPLGWNCWITTSLLITSSRHEPRALSLEPHTLTVMIKGRDAKRKGEKRERKHTRPYRNERHTGIHNKREIPKSFSLYHLEIPALVSVGSGLLRNDYTMRVNHTHIHTHILLLKIHSLFHLGGIAGVPLWRCVRFFFSDTEWAVTAAWLILESLRNKQMRIPVVAYATASQHLEGDGNIIGSYWPYLCLHV